jgi:hypothetical protein
MLANATSGLITFAVKDAVVAPGSSPSAATLTAESPYSSVYISGVTSGTTNTTVTTSTAHGLSVGDVVTNATIGGATQANGTFGVTFVGSGTTFNITTASTSAYTSGGTATKQIGQSWTAGAGTTVDDYIEQKFALSAVPVVDNWFVVALEGLTANWTLAAPVTVIPCILWE